MINKRISSSKQSRQSVNLKKNKFKRQKSQAYNKLSVNESTKFENENDSNQNMDIRSSVSSKKKYYNLGGVAKTEINDIFSTAFK